MVPFRLRLIILVLFCILSCRGQTYQWINHTSGTGGEGVSKVLYNGSGDMYVMGSFQYNVDFDPGPNTFTLDGGIHSDYIQKLTEDGKFIWAKKIGPGNIMISGMALDADENIFICGNFTGQIDFDPGHNEYVLSSKGECDAFLMKLDSEGKFGWIHVESGYNWSAANGLGINRSGDIYVTGVFTDSISREAGAETKFFPVNDEENGFVQKFSSSGELIWTRVPTIGKNICKRGYAIWVNYWDEIFIAGDGFFLKTNNDGVFKWSNPMEGNVFPNRIVSDPNGNLYITGTFTGPVDLDPGSGKAQYVSPGWAGFATKFTASGDYCWTILLQGEHTNSFMDLNPDKSGNLYLTAVYGENADLVLLSSSIALENEGATDILVLKIDNKANLFWYFTIGSVDWDWGAGITPDHKGGFYLTGVFQHTADFDPAEGQAILESAGFYDGFLAKYVESPLNVKDGTEGSLSAFVFPNPSSSEINFVFDRELINGSLMIYTPDGVLIKDIQVGHEKELKISGLPSGALLYKVYSGIRNVGNGTILIR